MNNHQPVCIVWKHRPTERPTQVNGCWMAVGPGSPFRLGVAHGTLLLHLLSLERHWRAGGFCEDTPHTCSPILVFCLHIPISFLFFFKGPSDSFSQPRCCPRACCPCETLPYGERLHSSLSLPVKTYGCLKKPTPLQTVQTDTSNHMCKRKPYFCISDPLTFEKTIHG